MSATFHIGETVKALREQRKLTQHELASALSVKQPMISHIENGERLPSHLLMAKLADFFGVSIDALYKGTLPVDS